MLFSRRGEDDYQQVRLPSDEDDCDVDDSDGGGDDDDDCSGGGGGGYQQVRLPTDAKTAVTYFGGRVQMLVILAPPLIALLCFGVALLCLFVCLFIMVCDCGLAVAPFHLLQPVLHVALVERNKES